MGLKTVTKFFVCLLLLLGICFILHFTVFTNRLDKKHYVFQTNGLPRFEYEALAEEKRTLNTETKSRRQLLFKDAWPPYFEPEVTEDLGAAFDIIDNKYRIPHIIHQTYKNESVPASTAEYILSFSRLNPNWTYFFWTDETARMFIKKKFSFFLPVWDSYKHYMHKADAIRYFVLYEYGGVYVDIDFECLRPLDSVTMKYSAIFPVEPFEQSAFRLDLSYLINNAIIFSKPKHPFLKRLIHRLEYYSRRMYIIEVAGPQFVTNEFNSYSNVSQNDKPLIVQGSDNSVPYFFSSVWKYSKTDMARAVYVPNTHYFMNTLASNFETEAYLTTCKAWLNKLVVMCRPNDQRPLCKKPTELQKRACNELFRRSTRLAANRFRFTYTKHHWISSYNKPVVNLDKTVDIRTLVPYVRFYTG